MTMECPCCHHLLFAGERCDLCQADGPDDDVASVLRLHWHARRAQLVARSLRRRADETALQRDPSTLGRIWVLRTAAEAEERHAAALIRAMVSAHATDA